MTCRNKMSLNKVLLSFMLRNSLRNDIYLNRTCFTTFPLGVCNSFSSKASSETQEKSNKKKTAAIPKITLLNGEELTVTTLEEAQKLSKRRDLKLVKLVDFETKTQRPVYKLLSGSEYHSEDIKQRALKKETRKNSIKGEKVLMINHNIFEHDLQTHIKKMKKWLDGMYEVKIVINGDISNMEKAESVYNIIEKSIGSEIKFVQKRQKGSDIRFQILPPPKKSNNEEKL